MGSILAALGGTVGVIFFLAVGVIQIIVGYLGIEYHLGSGWAVGAVILSLLLRISFPLTIGTFFGALNVLEWHWFAALLLTVPGLIFMVPGFFLTKFSPKLRKFFRETEKKSQN